MTRAPLLCAGLASSHLNAVCERRDTCRRYANWWATPGVQFNVCNPTGKPFKHYEPVGDVAASPLPTGETYSLFD
jgi:hypothetical protein